MGQAKTYISSILSVVILIASLLPALHVFEHDKSVTHDHNTAEKISAVTLDCDLCDFHFTSLVAPAVYAYELYIPLKESVYSISLTQTVNLFPDRLFSLRAPPVVIS